MRCCLTAKDSLRRRGIDSVVQVLDYDMLTGVVIVTASLGVLSLVVIIVGQ